MEFLREWIGPVGGLVALAVTAWGLFQSPSRANAKTLEDHGKTLTDHASRIQAVEAEQKHAPRKEDVHAQTVAIVELQGTVKAQNVQLESLARTVANIDGYLRKGDGK